jgi:hypothetical protein
MSNKRVSSQQLWEFWHGYEASITSKLSVTGTEQQQYRNPESTGQLQTEHAGLEL